MAIRFRRVSRLCDPTNKEAGKKVYPVISYQYDTSATLDEFAKEIASASGVSEGETISVLKDFRTLLRKTLLGGRSVISPVWDIFTFLPKAKGRRRRKILRSLIFQGFVSVFVLTRIFVCLPGRLPVRTD